jgi:Asp-tRNA(Asn)/Glu-tRNA(Gln) amidotransferase A subunit family amidase
MSRYARCSRRRSGGRGTRKRAHPRSGSAEAVREAASLLESLGHQVQEIAIQVEEGYADNFIKVWIAQTGDEVHTYERLCGRNPRLRPARAAQPRAVRALEPDHLPDYPGGLDWLRGYSRRLIAMWEQGDVLVTPTLARRAAGTARSS